MEYGTYSGDIDPEACEGLGGRVWYNPSCSESTRRAAERLQQALELDYQPTLASPLISRRRRWFGWLWRN